MNDAHIKKDIPESAFRFAAPVALSAATDASEPRKLSGVAYSGEVVRHGYWGAVVFDLSTTKAPQRMPVLVEHDRGQRAGFAQLSITNDRIDIAEGHLLANATGKTVAEEADAGFPWQLSVHIEPREVEQLIKGQSATVNDRQVNGPVSIFRNSLIREVSLTPTGVDHNTSATVFSAGANKEGSIQMSEVSQNDFSAQLAEKDKQIADLTDKVKSLTEAVSETQLSARKSEIKALFSSLGREFTEDEAKPYYCLDAATFSAIASDMLSVKPKLDKSLFSHQATEGVEKKGAVDPYKFSLEVQAYQDKAEAEGRTVSLLDAIAAVRAGKAN